MQGGHMLSSMPRVGGATLTLTGQTGLLRMEWTSAMTPAGDEMINPLFKHPC